MIGQVLEWVAGPLGIVVGAILALLAAWAKGKRDGRVRAALDAEKAYRETRGRIDDAANDLPDDDGMLREWLRDRGEP